MGNELFIIKNSSMKKTLVISAFICCVKTRLAENQERYGFDVYELDSDAYEKTIVGKMNISMM